MGIAGRGAHGVKNGASACQRPLHVLRCGTLTASEYFVIHATTVATLRTLITYRGCWDWSGVRPGALQLLRTLLVLNMRQLLLSIPNGAGHAPSGWPEQR